MKSLRYSLIAAGLLMGWLFAEFAAADVAPASPRDVIDRQLKEAIATLRDAKLSAAQKREKIGKLANEITDFESLSKLTMGKYWRDLSADQRAAFVEAFKTHLSNTYGMMPNGYTDEDVNVISDHRESNGDWTVQLSVVGTIAGGRHELAKVDCRLRRKTDWKVIDVIPEGISVAALFRAQFQDIMANGGFDRLLKLLREKAGEQARDGSNTHS